MFWSARDLVQFCEPGSDIPHLATSSTPEEWASKARALFDVRNYWHAMHCYERASLPREKAVANAYHLREQARKTSATKGSNTARADSFVLAAEAFYVSAQDASTEKSVYYRISAECFLQAGEYARAAGSYYMAGEYTLSAKQYRRAGLFDEAVKIVKEHGDSVEHETADAIINVSRIYYLREHRLS